MLTSGSEKWLHHAYEGDRREALRDSRRFTDAELDDLGVDRIRGRGVNDPKTYLIDTSPIDPNSDSGGVVDIRTIPGHD